MVPFDFQPQTRIVFGVDKIDQLGELAAELGDRRVLVVSDAGIIAAGHAERGMTALRHAGLQAHLFEGVHENPTTKDVETGLIYAQSVDPDVIVGLGGVHKKQRRTSIRARSPLHPRVITPRPVSLPWQAILRFPGLSSRHGQHGVASEVSPAIPA